MSCYSQQLETGVSRSQPKHSEVPNTYETRRKAIEGSLQLAKVAKYTVDANERLKTKCI